MDELLLYLIGFWRFVFSRQFRIDYLAAFERMNAGRKLLEIIGAATSVFVGIGLPVLIVALVVDASSFESKVDACLDSGGSFDYQACICDYKSSHPFQQRDQCK